MSMVFPAAPNNANTFLPPSPVVPMNLLIADISNANPCVITVTVDADQENDYVVGQLIYVTVPPAYGMVELNDQTFKIIAVSGDDLSINVNSTNFALFVVPVGNVEAPASISPAGSRNIYNYVQVPFHALDGTVGN